MCQLSERRAAGAAAGLWGHWDGAAEAVVVPCSSCHPVGEKWFSHPERELEVEFSKLGQAVCRRQCRAMEQLLFV